MFLFFSLLQIHPIHIDFGSAMGTYPPKYTFSIYGHDAIRENFATFKFKGVLPANLVYEVPLIYGSSHQPLRKVTDCFEVHIVF